MVIFILVKSFKASSVKKTKNNLLFDHLTQLDNMKEEWYYIQYLIVTENSYINIISSRLEYMLTCCSRPLSTNTWRTYLEAFFLNRIIFDRKLIKASDVQVFNVTLEIPFFCFSSIKDI